MSERVDLVEEVGRTDEVDERLDGHHVTSSAIIVLWINAGCQPVYFVVIEGKPLRVLPPF